MKHLGDICQIKGAEIEPVDVITGGSPCQDLSVAGGRAGLSGERSGLFMEMIRIIKEMRGAHGKPRYAIWENVPGCFSSNNGEDFRCVLEEFAHIKDPEAVVPGPEKKWEKRGVCIGDAYSIAWRTLNAAELGVPQRRERVTLIMDLDGGSAGEILFESEGMLGNPEESIPPWKGVARRPEECASAGGDGRDPDRPVYVGEISDFMTVRNDG